MLDRKFGAMPSAGQPRCCQAYRHATRRHDWITAEKPAFRKFGVGSQQKATASFAAPLLRMTARELVFICLPNLQNLLNLQIQLI